MKKFFIYKKVLDPEKKFLAKVSRSIKRFLEKSWILKKSLSLSIDLYKK
jgi:hypothetical protein